MYPTRSRKNVTLYIGLSALGVLIAGLWIISIYSKKNIKKIKSTLDELKEIELRRSIRNTESYRYSEDKLRYESPPQTKEQEYIPSLYNDYPAVMNNRINRNNVYLKPSSDKQYRRYN